MERLGWDDYFMGIADNVARRSACLARQVGTVLVDSKNILISTGYNGPPRGFPHCTVCAREKTKIAGQSLYECHTIHAEMNALLQCTDLNRVYKAYCTTSPCLVCVRLLANTECRVIVYDKVYDDLEKVIKFWETIPGRTILPYYKEPSQ